MAFYEDIFVYDTLQWEDEFNPLSPNHNHLNSSQNHHKNSFIKSDGELLELDDFNDLKSLKLKSVSSVTEQKTNSPSKSNNHNDHLNSDHLNRLSVSTDDDEVEITDAANLNSYKNCKVLKYLKYFLSLVYIMIFMSL